MSVQKQTPGQLQRPHVIWQCPPDSTQASKQLPASRCAGKGGWWRSWVAQHSTSKMTGVNYSRTGHTPWHARMHFPVTLEQLTSAWQLG